MSSKRRSRPRWTRWSAATGNQPQLPPAPVRVTIRVAAPVGPRRGMADVIQEIDADQRLRGFHWRTAAELQAEEEARQAEDDERDREQEAARHGASPGGP